MKPTLHGRVVLDASDGVEGTLEGSPTPGLSFLKGLIGVVLFLTVLGVVIALPLPLKLPALGILGAFSILFEATTHMRSHQAAIPNSAHVASSWRRIPLDMLRKLAVMKYQNSGKIGGIAALAFLVAAIGLCAVAGLGTSGSGDSAIVAWVTSAVAGAVACTIAVFLGAFTVPVLPRLLERFVSRALLTMAKLTSPQDLAKVMVERVGDFFADHPTRPILRGDLQESARMAYPPEQFPEMHKPTTADTFIHPIKRGKLYNGEDVSELAAGQISTRLVEQSYEMSFKRVIKGLSNSFAMLMVLTVVLVGIGYVRFHTAGEHVASAGRNNVYATSQNATSTVSDTMRIALAQGDVFSDADAQVVADQYRKDHAPSSGWFYKAIGFVVGALGTLLVPVGIATACALGLLAIGLRRALDPRNPMPILQTVINLDDTLVIPSKDSLALWSHEQEVAALELKDQRKMQEDARRDPFPLVQLGKGTGTLLFRGETKGYMEGQPVIMSLDDICRGGLMISGATGSGKSYALLNPILNGIFASPKAEYSLGMVYMDGKSAGIRSAIQRAKAAGWKIQVIGVRDGEFGVDVFEGIEPHVVAAFLYDIITQLSGSSTPDPFWVEMAAKILSAATRLAYVAEVTDYAKARAKAGRGRLYSPVGVFEIVSSILRSEGPMVDAINAVYAQAKSANPYEVVPLLNSDYFSAVDYLQTNVRSYSETTVGGFLTNCDRVLFPFVSKADVASRFGSACGTDAEIMPINAIFSDRTLTCFAMSEFRDPGYAQLTGMFFKLRAFHRACERMEQAADQGRDISKESKLVFVLDEAQRLVVGSSSQYGDAQMLSISRGAGLGFVYASQTLAAYRMTLGHERTENLLGAFRSKIFLAQEDNDSRNYILSLLGETKRAVVSGSTWFESFHAHRQATTGSTSFKVRPVELDDATVYSLADPRSLTQAYGGDRPTEVGVRKLSILDAAAARIQVMSLDTPEAQVLTHTVGLETYVAQEGGKGNDSAHEGYHDMALATDRDFNLLGQGRAIAIINRCATSRMDIIELTPELGFVDEALAA